MAYEIRIDGLREFKAFIDRDLNLQTIKLSGDIALDLEDLKETLDKRVSDMYRVPYQLNDVFIGKLENRGTNILDLGLAYRERKVPLSDYPYTQKEVSVRNAIPLEPEEGGKSFIPINKARQVRSNVRKRGGIELPRFRTKYPKFIGTDAQGNKRIFAREQKGTWLRKPTHLDDIGVARGGIRDNITMLFGPSLATLAERLFDRDDVVNAKVENITNKIVAGFVEFYS